MKTILIQGALEREYNEFVNFYKPEKTEIYGGFKFFIANYKGVKIIISETQIGIINASSATTIGILKYQPDVVICQGTSGSALENLNQGEIIVADSVVYINCFKQTTKNKGQGSNSLEWMPSRKRSYVINSTKELLNLAKEMGNSNFSCQVARLGSGDMFTREYDRINFLQKTFGHVAEDMETVASYKICEDFNIKHISFRIISNNELVGQEFDEKYAKAVQDFTIAFVDKLIAE